jgi:hypothetical protein
VVVRAGQAAPFFCQPLGREVDDSLGVILEHEGPGGRSLFSYYGHMSRVDVHVGDWVQGGQRIGLSGDSGCNDDLPHLHFGVWVRWGSDPQTFLDPVGWEGEGEDPWLVDSRGGEESRWLWAPGRAPRLYRELELSAAEVASLNAPVVVRYIRWMGWRDAINPNNEAVRIEVNPASSARGPVSLAGYTLSNGSGQVFTFPDGAQVAFDMPVWVYTGRGQDTGPIFFWGQPHGVWSDTSGCAALHAPDGSQVHGLGFVGRGDRTQPACPAPDMGEAYVP